MKSLKVGKRRASVGVGVAGENRQPVLSEHSTCDARERRAGADRLHEDVVTAVSRVLHQQAQIGEQDQALVGRPSSITFLLATSQA